MEATGTVVGVLSLGIALCDGIIQYCRAWKHQDDDVRALRELATGLRNVLQDFERWLQRQPNLDPTLVSGVRNSLQACNNQISNALGVSDKYATGQTTRKRGKVKDMIQRLKFPLERNVLGELRDIMVAFRGNVDIALNLLDIDLTASGVEAIQKLQNNNKNEHQEIISEIQNSATQITNSFIDDQDQKLSAHAHCLTTSIARHINGSGLSLENKISESSADLLSQFQVRSIELVMLHREQQKNLEKIASDHADILYSLHQIQEQVLVGAEHLSSPNLSFSNPRKKKRSFFEDASNSSSHCTCAVNAGIKNLDPLSHLKLRLGNPKWRFYKETEASIIHDRHCPMWYTSRKDTMYRFHSRVFGWRMSGSLELRISPHTAFSGWTILPSLNFRPVVSFDSPSFRVVLRYTRSWHDEPESIVNCLRDLRTVFQSGRGSPWDVLANGSSLLNIACRGLVQTEPSRLWQLTRGLLAMGTDIDEDIEGESLIKSIQDVTFSPMDCSPGKQIMSNRQQKMDFLLWCIQRGGQLTSGNLLGWTAFNEPFGAEPLFGVKIAVETLRAYEDLAAAASCGALSLAVLQRDLPGIRAILQQRPNSLEKERNIFGQTPLFLAVGWPNGLELLLQAANDSVLHDSCISWPSATPLDYAIALGCAESMKLLATRGLAFSFCWSYYVATTALESAASDFLLRLIMERCRQLHDFGLMALPEELIKSRQLDNFEFFISKAWLIFNYFRRNDIIIPAKFKSADYHYHWGNFCPRFGSIFHQDDLPLTTAQAFLNEGFNSIDIECEELTPLMCVGPPHKLHPWEENTTVFERFFKFVDFLVERGARLDKEIPQRYIAGLDLTKSETRNQHQVIHRVASLSWCNLFQPGATFELVIPDILRISELGSSEVWRCLITSMDSDPCLCACSSDGCRPISLALKLSVLQSWRPETPPWKPFSDLRNWERTLEWLTVLATLLGSLTGQYLVRDVVRFLTFSALELTHTCCKHEEDFSISDLVNESEKILDYWPIAGSEIHESMEDSWAPVMIRLMNPTETQEIREEEASMIDRLDFLIEEFMKEIDELAISLPEFLRTRWPERMYAELSDKDEMSEIEQRAFVELGVKILEDDNQTEEMAGKRPNVPKDDYDEWIRSLEESIK